MGPARQSWRRDAEATRGDGEERERKVGEAFVRAIIIKGRRGRTRGVAGVDAGTGARALPWRPDVRERHVAEQERRRFVGWCCWREHRIRCRAWDGLFGCLDLAGHI